MRALLLILVVSVAASSACFSPSFDSCAVQCGAGGSCPDGMTCLGDGICHRSAGEALCAPRPDADPNQPDADPNQPDADPGPDAAPPVTPDTAGQLVISEIMIDPGRTPEEPHEWFEIYNPSDTVTYDLLGMLIGDFSGDEFDIERSVLVPPGGYVVIGEEGDPDVNGGVAVDYDYPNIDFNLGNSDDEVIIVNPINDVVIDDVLYGFNWDSEGSALSLDPAALDSISNDLSANWCDASTPFGDELPIDNGSPGAANPDCP